MPKRKSLKGMGADAYFEAPASQQTSEPVEQQDSKTVSRLVKATFYLTPGHIMHLERLKLKRKESGQRVDKSALIREAIDLLKD